VFFRGFLERGRFVVLELGGEEGAAGRELTGAGVAVVNYCGVEEGLAGQDHGLRAHFHRNVIDAPVFLLDFDETSKNSARQHGARRPLGKTWGLRL